MESHWKRIPDDSSFSEESGYSAKTGNKERSENPNSGS